MPQKVVTYFCEICGRGFCKESEAVKCEKAHYVPISADSPSYNKDEHSTKAKYPESVLVHFKDGEGNKASARYYRAGNNYR